METTVYLVVKEILQNLITKISKSISLSSQAEAHLYSIATIKEIKKGEVLIRQGQSVSKTYFVTDGCL